MRLCSIEGCSKIHKAKGYCRKHYERWFNNGNPLIALRNYEHSDNCSIANCNKPYARRGYCHGHYKRLMNGDINENKPLIKYYNLAIECFNDNFRVNDQNCWIWKGRLNYTGYGTFKFKGKNYSAHRFSYKYHYGEFDESLFVCHHCDIRRCCNPEHLFLGTHTDNMQDCIKKNRHRWRK